MHPPDIDSIKKYLPSKKFSVIIGGGFVLVLSVLIISGHFGTKGFFNSGAPVSSDGTVSDIVSRDSNNNGIPDWEESLYGLDPTADGATNKAIIEQKEAQANVTPPTDDDSDTATDAFSQQLLSTILALHQSGTLTPEVIAKVAASVGDSVDAKHTSANTYTMSDIKISPKSPAAAKAAYRVALKAVIDQYSDVDLGSETTIISDGLGDGGADALTALAPIASAYTQLAQQVIALPTPAAVAQNALDLANSSAQMGASLLQVENIYTDAISGMVGIDDYTKASTLSDEASATLASYFAN